MIAASEPWEFIPRGRQAVEEHPDPCVEKKPLVNLPNEHVLLQRLQKVNISAKEEYNEFWCMRSVYDSSLLQRQRQKEHEMLKKNSDKQMGNLQQQKQTPPTWKANTDFMSDIFVNSEEELYVKKYVAVWTRGLADERSVLPRISFSCDLPIKFALFCNKSFVRSIKQQAEEPDEHLTVICLIDEKSLRVYCSDGEDFVANLEFPVSQVWSTCYGLLLEKVASTTTVQHHSIPLPRLFSLSHPLNEISPVLNKSATNVISYLTDNDYTIVFTAENTDLILLYDRKIGKHYVSRLRKASEDEINFISCQNETGISGSAHHHSTQRAGTISSGAHYSMSQNSLKLSAGLPKNSTATVGRASLGANSSYTMHIGKFLSSANSLQRNSVALSLSQLQSSMAQNSLSMHDLRRMGQAQPTKPIVPQLCLEHLWTENTFGSSREFCEVAKRAFFHSDLLGQMFLCYLLPRSCKLQLVLLTNFGEPNVQFSTLPTTILAKDAVSLERLRMIAVLDPSGSLCLYTGTVFVAKVHVKPSMSLSSGFLTPNAPLSSPQVGSSAALKTAQAQNSSFPRRSSLLPTAQKQPETSFDEELHMLSPVQPLHPTYANRNNNICCLGLRDPANNRLTLVYPNGKMYRLTLPLLYDFKGVGRCLKAMQNVLKRDHYLQLLIRMYAARNPPGARNYTFAQEWQVFRNVLLDMLGFNAALQDSMTNTSHSFNAEEPKKRRKNDEEINTGSEEDWQFMQKVLKQNNLPYADNVITTKANVEEIPTTPASVDTNSILFSMLPAVFYCLHLLYEDFKLDCAMEDYLPNMAELLYQLSLDMKLQTYTYHYALDYPELVARIKSSYMLTEQLAESMLHKELLNKKAPSVFLQLLNILQGKECSAYDYIVGVNNLSRNVLQICSQIMHGDKKMREWINQLEFKETVDSYFPKPPKRMIPENTPRFAQTVEMMLCMEMTREKIERLPVAVHLIIAEALEHVRLAPPMGCKPEYYALLLRSELVQHAKLDKVDTLEQQLHKRFARDDEEDSLTPRCKSNTIKAFWPAETKPDDGMNNIDTKLLSLRFPDDMRIAEVRRLLTSSEPVLIDLTQAPGVSDHEFIEEQEKQLLALCMRTMTLPVGRGMFTLRTAMPSPTESMPIPKLCLVGKEPSKGATIEMQQIEFPTNMNLWPTFHNGVAAGLKISPQARDVDSTWIVYNKPKGQGDIPSEHAGFLMALGLNGHLKSLSFMSIYDYLVRCDEMASVGLMLGIAATHRGTMDNTTTKLLSVHVESLLPATALELDIPQNIQVAALMGIGLLYQGTAKRHIAEALLQEIGRPPGPEMENSIERESYALTAGLALGLVTLGQGESPAGLLDLQLPDNLHYYMVGGNKRALSGAQKEKYKLPSFQVREGDQVNLDVTAPGATLALGLMFFNTNNTAVAEWMEPPKSRYLLDLVRPDFLLLRTIAHGLIMWSNIRPDEDWLFDQFPENLRFDVESTVVPPNVPGNEDDDDEAITQAYCNIMAGAAFCIGLKYAGSENPVAFKTLRRALTMFMGFTGKYVGEYAGRNTIENCTMLILLSISLVFAGSGNIEILRLIRFLRSRIGPTYTYVTYGSHIAIHMSLGFLFLGAGRFTLSQSPEAVAALVCALFPKFPINSNDNRYHLQAFRHLYVLAVQPRLFLPRDIDTKKLCLCNISVLEIGAKEYRRLPIAPCMLPDLHTLQAVKIDDPNYWPVCFEKSRNWEQLLNALNNCACIDIKKRLGCLSYLEDPDRLKSLFAQTLTKEQYHCWDIDAKVLQRFFHEPFIIDFTDNLLYAYGTDQNEVERKRRETLILLFYNAIINDKMHLIPIYLEIFNINLQIQKYPQMIDVWQLRLIETYLQKYQFDHKLISKELVSAEIEKFKIFIENCRDNLAAYLQSLLISTDFDLSVLSLLPANQAAQMNAVLNYYTLTPGMLKHIKLGKQVDFFEIMRALQGSTPDAEKLYAFVKIAQATSKKSQT